MKQAIAGIVPPEVREATVLVAWPTIGATRAGRLVGRLAGISPAWDRLLIVGKLAAAITIPISLTVFIWQLLPRVCRRYLLTNRRIVVAKGLTAVEERAIGLDQFDAVEIRVLPGQQWLRAGELIFNRAGQEVFRLSGVSRPEPFRVACQKAQSALTVVRAVVQQQAERHCTPVVG